MILLLIVPFMRLLTVETGLIIFGTVQIVFQCSAEKATIL